MESEDGLQGEGDGLVETLGREPVLSGNPDGQPVFRELARLKTAEVTDVVQITKVRVRKVLERRGLVRVSPESLEVDDVLSACDPVLAQLAAAAVAGVPRAEDA